MCRLSRGIKHGNRQTNEGSRNRAVNEVQGKYSDDGWSYSLEDDTRSMDVVTIKPFDINSVRSVILTKLETCSKHARCK